MTSKPPPVPPAGRNRQADDGTPREAPKQGRQEGDARKGRQANIEQNTTHQGYQQDR